MHVCVSIIQQYRQVEGVIYSNWILIYTCSTLSVCSNRWLLQDINNAKDMRYYTLWKIADHINMIWLEQSRPFQYMHTTTQIHLQIFFFWRCFIYSSRASKNEYINIGILFSVSSMATTWSSRNEDMACTYLTLKKKSNTDNIPVTNEFVAHYSLLITVANNQHNDIQLYIFLC